MKPRYAISHSGRSRQLMLVLNLCLTALLLTGCFGRGTVDTKGTQTLPQKLDTVLHRLDGSGAIVSARFLEVPSGNVLYETDNTDYPFEPASNMKLLITATGLDHFGAGHVFKTYLALDGDDLWIIGTGDPATGDPAIAKDQGVAMPSFFGYMIWSFVVLIPVYLVAGFVFF